MRRNRWFLLACLAVAIWGGCQIWESWSRVQYNMAEIIYLDKLNGFDKGGVSPIH